jgi:hypothetical protein
MNAVNRFVMVILILVVMVMCSLVLVIPIPMLQAVGDQASALVGSLKDLEWYVRLLPGIFLALLLDFILVLVLILELRRPVPKFIRVEKAAGGEVQVSVTSIADRLRYEVDQLTSVLRTKPKVTGRRGGIVVKLDVETVAGIDVPRKADAIVETARLVVEDKMGLKLARPPKVDLRSVPYPRTSFQQPERSVAPKKEAPSDTSSGALAAPVEPAEPEETSSDLLFYKDQEEQDQG